MQYAVLRSSFEPSQRTAALRILERVFVVVVVNGRRGRSGHGDDQRTSDLASNQLQMDLVDNLPADTKRGDDYVSLSVRSRVRRRVTGVG